MHQDELTQAIRYYQEEYDEVQECWDKKDISGELVYLKYEISMAINSILSGAGVDAIINGDYIEVRYWSEDIKRNIIIDTYSMEKIAEFKSFELFLIELLSQVNYDKTSTQIGDYKDVIEETPENLSLMNESGLLG